MARTKDGASTSANSELANFEMKSRACWIALFVLLSLALAVPFLCVDEPPLLDYPNHLARAFVLAHLHDPAYHFSAVYRADWRPYPYVLWDAAAVALQRVVSAEIAGKLLLIFSTVLLPISVAWFLWQANRESIGMAPMACVLAYNTLFFWGFTAYHLSIGCCFLMVGAWLWYRRSPSMLRAGVFLASSFAAYFAHLLGFAASAFILVFYVLTERPTEKKLREWLRLAAFLAPPALLFLWARPGLGGPKRLAWRPFADRLREVYELTTQDYDIDLNRILIAGLVACFLIAVVRNRELKVSRRWLIVTVAFFVIYLLLPFGWGASSDLDVRFVAPLCLLPLAVLQVGKRAKWIAALAVALTLLRVYNVATGFRAETARNAAMNHGIEQIARNARVFPVVDTCKDEDPLDYYYVHYWAYAVIRRGAISPYLFDIPGQTPMRITWEPYTAEGYWEHCYSEEEPDWQQVAGDYDYIWTYGDQRFTQGIRGVADPVFEEKPLVVYRVRR
jgi:hypothetical protein